MKVLDGYRKAPFKQTAVALLLIGAVALVSTLTGCSRLLTTTVSVVPQQSPSANTRAAPSPEDIATVEKILQSFAKDHGFVVKDNPAGDTTFADYKRDQESIKRQVLARTEDDTIVVDLFEFSTGGQFFTGYGSLEKDLIRRLKKAFPGRVRVRS